MIWMHTMAYAPCSVIIPHRFSIVLSLSLILNVLKSNRFALYQPFPTNSFAEYRLRHVCLEVWVHTTSHHIWWRNWSYSLWMFYPKRFCQNYQIGLPNLLLLVRCRLRHVCLEVWVTHCKKKHFKSHYGINVEVIPFGFSVNNVLVKFSKRSAQSNTLASKGMYALQCDYSIQVIPFLFYIHNVLWKNQMFLLFYQQFPTN